MWKSSKAKILLILLMHCSMMLKAWWPSRYAGCWLSRSVLAATLTIQVQIVFISHDKEGCLYQKIPVGGGVVLWWWYNCKWNGCKMEKGYLFQVCRVKKKQLNLVDLLLVCQYCSKWPVHAALCHNLTVRVGLLGSCKPFIEQQKAFKIVFFMFN